MILRRQLARELKAMREEAGYTLEQAAKLMYWSTSTMSRVETGQVMVDIHRVRGLLSIYDLGGLRGTRIEEMTLAAMGRGWWRAYGIKDRDYVPLEAESTLVRAFEPTYVPGLLQTQGYVQTIYGSALTRRAPERIDQLIELRRTRQRRLTSEVDPLELVVVVDEAVLLRQVGGPEVMRDQLEHLLIAAELDTVTLQVLPFRAGHHPSMAGGFRILSYGELGEPDLAYVEHSLGAVEHSKATDVERAILKFERLRSLALSPADTVELVSEVLDRM